MGPASSEMVASKRPEVSVAGVAEAGGDEGGGGKSVIESGSEDGNVRMQSVEVFIAFRGGDDADENEPARARGLEL